MKKKQSQKNRNVVLIVVLLFVLIAAFWGGVIYYRLHRSAKAQTTAAAAASSQSESTTAAPKESQEDAKAYYSKNSEKLLAVIPVKESKAVYSEAAVSKALSARGFGKTAASYAYDMAGTMSEKAAVDSSSSALHPQYTAAYKTGSGDYWTITICNDCITAYPVTYNLEHNSGAEVIFAEGESITAYDSATNCFYETIPKPETLVVKRIPSITAEALEQLSAQEIEKL